MLVSTNDLKFLYFPKFRCEWFRRELAWVQELKQERTGLKNESAKFYMMYSVPHAGWGHA